VEVEGNWGTKEGARSKQRGVLTEEVERREETIDLVNMIRLQRSGNRGKNDEPHIYKTGRESDKAPKGKGSEIERMTQDVEEADASSDEIKRRNSRPD